MLLDLHFLLQRLFFLYPFFLLAHTVLCKRIYHISKSLKAWMSTHVDTGMSWPSYTYLVWTPTRLAFPCTFHPKSGVFTSASLLTHYNYICHLHSHPFPAYFYRADGWCFSHAVTCNKIFVFPVAKCDVKKMLKLNISHCNTPKRDCRLCSRSELLSCCKFV